MLPGRAGQSTQIQVHMTLAQLRGLAGASATEAAWAAARASQPGWVTGPEAEAAACDASVVPIVTGHLDWTALDRLTEVFLTAHARWPATPGSAGHVSSGAGEAHGVSKAAGQPDRPGSAAGQPDRPGSAAGQPGRPGSAAGQPGRPGSAAGQPGRPGSAPAAPSGGTGEAGGVPGLAGSADGPFSPKTRQRLRRALLALAADTLAGPGGLAAQLRAGLDGPLASVSLPLDVGPATETIPAHLRRAATTRHPHCAFPGCAQPASVCDIHHIIPRSRGGPTSLDNLLTMCTFHHKIVIHRWGWSVRLNSDGTTTATSPDGRTLHSHGPPSRAA